MNNVYHVAMDTIAACKYKMMLHFRLPLTYSLLPWILLLTMQIVSINNVGFNVGFPIASYLFLVAMDTIINNAEGKYQ